MQQENDIWCHRFFQRKIGMVLVQNNKRKLQQAEVNVVDKHKILGLHIS